MQDKENSISQGGNKNNFKDFMRVAYSTLGSSFTEKKKRFYVKVNKGSFSQRQEGVDFVLALLLFQIKNNVSDLFYEACNNIYWWIRYIQNWVLEQMTYDDIKNELHEVIDYFYQDEDETYRKVKKEYYETFFGKLDYIKFTYDKNELKKTIDISSIDDKKEFEDLSERKMKLLVINKINEALSTLYWFSDQIRNIDSSIVIWYWSDDDEVIPEYSFRIAGKQQDIEIEGTKFFNVIQRFMLTEFFPLSKLGLGDFEPFVRNRLPIKKLNIIAGETSSGKTTTILSLMNELNVSFDGKVKFYSFEDPPEKIVDFMIQTQASKNILNESMQYTAEDAERFFLRWAPDGILIGEMRDLITAQIAIKMAMSGHYCYATLHCDSVLSVIPRFWGWWLDMKSNITALGFVEVTQLVTTYLTDDYDEKLPIDEKINKGILKIKDLKDIPFEKLVAFEKMKKGEIDEQQTWLNEQEILLFDYINGRSFLKDIFTYYHTKQEGVLFFIQSLYLKYLHYISTYFSNRYVDGVDFMDKKQYVLPFLKALNIALKNPSFQNRLIAPNISKETLKEIFKEVFTYVNSELSEFEIQLLGEGKNVIQNFIFDKYVSSSDVRIPFTFDGFLDVIANYGFLPFKQKPKGRMPIVEFFDYVEDYKCVLQKDYDFLLYKTKVFSPMFLYAFTVNQKTVQKGKCFDFFKIVSMFSVEYEL